MAKCARITLLDGTELYKTHIEYSLPAKWRYHLILYHFYVKMMGGRVTKRL